LPKKERAVKKKGTTLLESVIALFLVAVVVVTLLEALALGIIGTLNVNRQSSALSLAKTQIEYIKSQTYNASAGSISDIYGLATAAMSNWSFSCNDGEMVAINGIQDIRYGNDTVGKYAYKRAQTSSIACSIDTIGNPQSGATNHCDVCDNTTLNYGISGNVTNVSTSLQKITVNVSYLPGKVVQLTSYKGIRSPIYSTSSYRHMLVTDNIRNIPVLYPGSGGAAIGCNPVFPGYYHVFNTSGGTISINWNFHWTRMDNALSSMGAPMIAIYDGVPVWANRDYLGVVKNDGLIFRQQDQMGGGNSIGALPGAGSGNSNCQCYCTSGCPTENVPRWFIPHDSLYGGYPCSGAKLTGDEYWTYDYAVLWPTSYNEDDSDRTFTISLDPGQYTILFFNAEDKIYLDTISASVTYIK
jgi:type II secretory pathway pseudopilin PulG